MQGSVESKLGVEMGKRPPKKGHGGRPRKKNTELRAYWRRQKRNQKDKRKKKGKQ